MSEDSFYKWLILTIKGARYGTTFVFELPNGDSYEFTKTQAIKTDFKWKPLAGPTKPKRTTTVRARTIQARKRAERKQSRRKVDYRKYYEDLCAIYGAACARCGAHPPLAVDHVNPRHYGGSDGIWNLQLLCRSCNSWKGTRAHDFRPANWPDLLAEYHR